MKKKKEVGNVVFFLFSFSLFIGPIFCASWLKSSEKMTSLRDLALYQKRNKIEYEKDISVNLTVPLSLIYRHCYNRRTWTYKKDLGIRRHDELVHSFSQRFSRGKPPLSAEEEVKTLPKSFPRGERDFKSAGEIDRGQRELFLSQFGVDPRELDVHDYWSNFVDVSIQFLQDQCVESALPFYFPWLFIDEADVIFIETTDKQEMRERIERGCPPPSKRDVACLIYLRSGQVHKRVEKVFVLKFLLELMEERDQKFVLVTAWQEIWCTPYSIQQVRPPKNPSQVEPYFSIHLFADKILESPLLVAWFGKNLCIEHPKLHPVPLGAKREPNLINTKERMFKKDMWLSLDGHRPQYLFEKGKKETLLAPPMFEISTTGSPSFGGHRHLRIQLMEHLETTFGKDYVDQVKNRTAPTGWPRVEKDDALSFFKGIQNTKFNFAPVGAAIDSHRAWESLMLGTIPIVFNSTLNRIFEGLPVLILSDMSVTNREYLEKVYREMRKGEYDWNRLYGFYWIEKVRRATLLPSHPHYSPHHLEFSSSSPTHYKEFGPATTSFSVNTLTTPNVPSSSSKSHSPSHNKEDDIAFPNLKQKGDLEKRLIERNSRNEELQKVLSSLRTNEN